MSSKGEAPFRAFALADFAAEPPDGPSFAGASAAQLLAAQIGRHDPISTPLGVKPLVYADWTASARALAPVEAFLACEVLPAYGNTHTAASTCGAQASSFVAEARARYLAAWAALGARADSAAPLRLRDVPWPRRAPPSAPGGDEAEASFSVEEVATRVFDASMDGAARRRAVQAELRRWHPDKFVGRWGSRVLPEEREVLLLRIKQVAQCLTELLNRPG